MIGIADRHRRSADAGLERVLAAGRRRSCCCSCRSWSTTPTARSRATARRSEGTPPTPAARTSTGSATTTCPRSRSARWPTARSRESGHDWLLLAALVAILSVVRVAYSARDHVLLGLYRDRPELRELARVPARRARPPGRRPRAARPRGRLRGPARRRGRQRLAVAALDQPRPGARVPRLREPAVRRSSRSTWCRRARRRVPGRRPDDRARACWSRYWGSCTSSIRSARLRRASRSCGASADRRAARPHAAAHRRSCSSSPVVEEAASRTAAAR